MAVNASFIKRPSDRNLYLAAAIVFPLVVLTGYFKSYYFSALFTDVQPIANALVHAHITLSSRDGDSPSVPQRGLRPLCVV